jgi:hypothetical protein
MARVALEAIRGEKTVAQAAQEDRRAYGRAGFSRAGARKNSPVRNLVTPYYWEPQRKVRVLSSFLLLPL